MHPNPIKVIYTMSDRNVDIKGLNVPIRIRKLKNRQHNGQKKKDQRTAMIYKTLYRKFSAHDTFLK